MATFHLMNFGCRASQADGAALKRELLEAGLEELASFDQSAIAVLNTCTVTAVADAEVRQVMRRIHRQNPSCRILVTGCYAQRAPSEIAEFPGVAWVVGNSHKHVVAELLKQRLESEAVRPERFRAEPPEPARMQAGGPAPVGEPSGLPGKPEELAYASSELVQLSGLPPAQRMVPGPPEAQGYASRPTVDHAPEVLVGEISEAFHFAPVFADDRTRPTLKIQDGCNARCSFCVIPSVRGPSRSLAAEKVIEQIRELGAQGYKEIVLSGINLGSYGKDLDHRVTFLALLERILAETSIPRLRISSIEPMDVSPELVRLVAREPRLAEHFHVPLQSGCDRILRQMNRRYWTTQYAERILAIREAIPNGAIGADVMVGFPGETAEEHASSARFIESLPFTYLHIFPYSARPATSAAALPNPVNGRVARERSREIRALVEKKRRTFLAAQIGRAISAVTLDETNEGARLALSSHYLKVAIPGSPVAPNTLLDLHVGRVADGILYAYPVESQACTTRTQAGTTSLAPNPRQNCSDRYQLILRGIA